METSIPNSTNPRVYDEDGVAPVENGSTYWEVGVRNMSKNTLIWDTTRPNLAQTGVRKLPKNDR